MAQAEIIIADDALLPEAVQVHNEIFRPAQDVAYFKRYFLGRYNPLILIARVGQGEHADRAVGVLFGYEERPGLFRHWMGAVLPEFRRQGIARQLQEAEHAWAAEHGYTAIRAEATNRQKEFLQFAIATGYDVIGLRYEGDRAANMIVLEYPLIEE